MDASVARRFASGAADLSLFAVPLTLLRVIGTTLRDHFSPNMNLSLLAAVVLLLLAVLSFQLLRIVRRGSSVGMALLRLRTVNSIGETNFVDCVVLRTIVPAVAAVVAGALVGRTVLPIVGSLILVDSTVLVLSGRSLRDRLTGTTVVQLQEF